MSVVHLSYAGSLCYQKRAYYVTQTHKRLNTEKLKKLFIMTKYNIRILGVIPFFKLQNNT